jgi:hypothetical protein
MEGTSRVGTINDSYYSIKNRIDMLEDEGAITVKTVGKSPDGKVTNEFHIFPAPFIIYDYKFGLDPSDEDNFEEEFPFSVGGKSQNALKSAKALGFNVVDNNMEVKDEMSEKELNEAFVRQMQYKAGIIK